MRIERNEYKYVFYGSKDLTRLGMVMDSDSDGHWSAREKGLEQISEVDYWLAKCRQERDERERGRVEDAIRLANSDGWSVIFL